MAETTNELEAAYRPFSCSECSKSFTRSENLQRHKRARHSGAIRKPFECAGCQARFSRSDVYKRHSERCRQLASQRYQPESDDSPPVMADLNPQLPTSNLVVPEHPWPEEPIAVANESPQTYSGSSPSIANGETTALHVKGYFENFHASLPLLHRPTFTTSSAPELLVNIVSVIGSLYSSQPYDPNSRGTGDQWRRDCWKRGNKDLQRLVAADYSEMRKTWVLQTWLLHIVYGAYLNDTTDFEESKKMLRIVVDAARELGLLRQGITMPDSLSWASQADGMLSQDGSKTPYTRWMSYVSVESLKVALYTLVFLDSHIFSPANIRPLISAMEFGWELPFPGDLWEAKNPRIWTQRVTEHFGMAPENYLCGPRGIATASLSIATQQLMSESPSPELLAALTASPFTTLCILMNINTLIRDFTRCYYQLPPSPWDPSAFHIFTQSQNKQIYGAMCVISRIVKDQAYTTDSPQFLLWRTVDILHCSAKISLCRPDHLLIGGIVDNSVIAGLATSTHLTLGDYVSVRRSAPLRPPHLWGDEGILAVLNDLASVLTRIAGEEGEGAFREAPWVTAASYGILLCVWAALRRAGNDIQNGLDTFNELPRTSKSCVLIFNTLMESVLLCLKAGGGGGEGTENTGRDPRIWSTDRDSFVTLLDQGELLFVSLLQRVCRDRYLWSIGPSMATVVDEILASSQTTTTTALA
ncbi:fungal-specific transcription factor domain-containing protein [Aspergillus pseudoustus]|uniref:Fungal-specific transcription factor domain-containing protein n=1 Tax=Aspergillus pseudoustus TaxID=1810923 RepID=A0ABR4JF11_9EURO